MSTLVEMIGASPERSAAMTDLEKELVEKLAIEEQRPFYGATQDIADMPIEVARKRVEVMFMPLIRSHTQALVAAAYAACAEHCPMLSLDSKVMWCSCGWRSKESPTEWAAHIRSLTPADAARELERRELEARIEQMKKVSCQCPLDTWKAANDWMNQELAMLRASLSKPAPVETVKTVRSCNRHDDCDKADEAVKAKGGFAASHCHDECCDECFGA